MEKQILQDEGKIRRVELLRDSAQSVEDFAYPRSLDPDELAHLKDKYSQQAIKLSKATEAKKEFTDNWNVEMKPVKTEMAAIMSKLRTKIEEINEPVYLIPDFDVSKMGYYNAAGNLVYERPLMPDEKQFSLTHNSHQKEGTNNF